MSLLLDTEANTRYTITMPRLVRAVIPGLPHHVTQRGNYRQDVFLREEDRTIYLETRISPSSAPPPSSAARSAPHRSWTAWEP